VEARRNSNDSLARLLRTVEPVLADGLSPCQVSITTTQIFLVIDKEFFELVMKSLIDGLDDYTVDERGDVGSWVRISSIKALGDITPLIIRSPLNGWVTRDLYGQIWAGLLKQGAERLDNVRAEVERQLLQLLQLVESTKHDTRWVPPGYELMKKLFMTE
jgi:tubulin-specific chaperone D